MNAETLEWGWLMDKWHDQLSLMHLLKGDGSPACGCAYYTSSGPAPDAVEHYPKCGNCKRSEARQERVAKKAPLLMYRVTWTIDVEAMYPRAAAQKAQAAQRRRGTTATVFEVREVLMDDDDARVTSNTWTVDLEDK